MESIKTLDEYVAEQVAQQKQQVDKDNILQEAHKVIYGDREKTYGRPDKNLTVIARMWDAYLGRPYGTLSPLDVCNMMVLLKTARLANDPTHRDSLIDICGYAALSERVQEYQNVGSSNSNQASTLKQG